MQYFTQYRNAILLNRAVGKAGSLILVVAVGLTAACSSETPPIPNNRQTAGAAQTKAENDAEPVDKGSPAEKEADPKTPGIESIYTELGEDKCVDAEIDEEEQWSVQSCKGVAGYGLLVSEGDLRQTIDIVSPAGDRTELNLWQVVSSAFSTVGDKAEWRVVRDKNGRPQPVALIVRYNVNEDPENTDKITSYLTVSKIGKEGTCITDIVKPIRNANERARTLADKSADRPCLGTISTQN